MEKLELWLKNSFNTKNYEDLFFILVEAKDSSIDVPKKTYQKISNILVQDFRKIYNEEVYGMYAYNNYYHMNKNNHEKENMMDCFDVLLSITKKKLPLTNNTLYLVYKLGGEKILKKHDVNIGSKEFLTEKLSSIYLEKDHEYRRNSDRSVDWYNGFLESMKKYSEGADVNIIYSKVGYSVLGFAAAIELGYEPSKKQILDMFTIVWNKLTYTRKNELHFFCDSFSKTNVFQNSLAPAKNIQILLKQFFKDYLVNHDEEHVSMDRVYPHEDKVRMLFNHPAFLHENIKKQILRRDAQKFLGKSFVTKSEEKMVIEQAVMAKTSVKKNKI